MRSLKFNTFLREKFNKETITKIKKITFSGIIFTSSYFNTNPITRFNKQNDIIVNAVQGSIKTSSLEESKAAVSLIKRCLDSLNDMEAAAKNADYEGVGKL